MWGSFIPCLSPALTGAFDEFSNRTSSCGGHPLRRTSHRNPRARPRGTCPAGPQKWPSFISAGSPWTSTGMDSLNITDPCQNTVQRNQPCRELWGLFVPNYLSGPLTIRRCSDPISAIPPAWASSRTVEELGAVHGALSKIKAPDPDRPVAVPLRG